MEMGTEDALEEASRLHQEEVNPDQREVWGGDAGIPDPGFPAKSESAGKPMNIFRGLIQALWSRWRSSASQVWARKPNPVEQHDQSASCLHARLCEYRQEPHKTNAQWHNAFDSPTAERTPKIATVPLNLGISNRRGSALPLHTF